jgi:hypothetical protein
MYFKASLRSRLFEADCFTAFIHINVFASDVAGCRFKSIQKGTNVVEVRRLLESAYSSTDLPVIGPASFGADGRFTLTCGRNG